MKSQKNKDLQIIEELRRRFDAKVVDKRPDQEDLQILEERNKLEEIRWRYVDYLKYFDLIKCYGLDLKLMDRLKWNIVWSLKIIRKSFWNQSFISRLKIMIRLNGLSQNMNGTKIEWNYYGNKKPTLR